MHTCVFACPCFLSVCGTRTLTSDPPPPPPPFESHACAGTLVSTCFFQLWIGALVLGAVLVPLLHPEFWVFVRDNIGWPISIALIILWHILSQIFLNRYVTDGKRIKKPFVWLFAYVALSSAYCVVRTPTLARPLVPCLPTQYTVNHRRENVKGQMHCVLLYMLLHA